MRLGIDTSNYSGPLTPEQLTAVKAKGYDFAIVGCQTGLDGANYTAQQIAACQAAGIEVVGVYEFLYWDDRDLARMQHAASFGLPVRVDCEYAVPPNWTPERVVEQIHAACNYLTSLNLLAGIYTDRWIWPSLTGDSKDFSQYPLWHAAYTTAPAAGTAGPPPNFDSFTPYGGWSRPDVWQYAGSVRIAGVLCDLDAMEVAPVPAPTEDIFHALVRTLATDYRVAEAGMNPIGQRVAHVLQADGSDANPGIYIAIKSE